jgi:hypothetical protein
VNGYADSGKGVLKMLNTVKAIVKEGRIELMEQIGIPGGVMEGSCPVMYSWRIGMGVSATEPPLR